MTATIIDLSDVRLIDKSRNRPREGAKLLRSPVFLAALRSGEHFRLAADDDWRNPHVGCGCGRLAEFNAPGLDGPICEHCMADALECLAIVDGDGPEAA